MNIELAYGVESEDTENEMVVESKLIIEKNIINETKNIAADFTESPTRRDLLTKVIAQSCPPPVNPFVDANDNGRSVFEIIKMVILCILLIPLIRLILLILMVVICTLWCIIVSYIAPKKGYLKDALLVPVKFMPRIALFILGFYYIPVIRLPGSSPSHNGILNCCFCCRGRLGSCCSSSTNLQQKKRAKVFVCNHTTLLDVFVLMYHDMPSFLAKASVLEIPLIGTIARTLNVIGVERESSAAREKSKTEMMNHVNDPDSSPLCVFPEGTTTRSDTIMRFKNGAFIFEQPVQPILLIWNPSGCFSSFKSYDLANTATTNEPYWLFSLLCQFSHSVKMVYLPIYEPSEIEKVDTNLFADRVRDLMLKEIAHHSKDKVWACDQTVDDFLIWKKVLDINFFGNYQALSSYSLYDVRQTLNIITLGGTRGVDLGHMRHVVGRYKILFYWQEYQIELFFVIQSQSEQKLKDESGAVIIQNQLGKNDKIASRNLKKEDQNRFSGVPVGYISAEAISKAFKVDVESALSIFQVFEQVSHYNSSKEGWLDFRQITVSLLYFSPLSSLWDTDNANNHPYIFDLVAMWLEHKWRLAHAIFGGGIIRRLYLDQVITVLCSEHPSTANTEGNANSKNHVNGSDIAIPIGVGKPALLTKEEVTNAWKELGFEVDESVERERFVQAGIELGLKMGSLDVHFSASVRSDIGFGLKPKNLARKGYVLLDAAWAYIDRCFIASQAELFNLHPRAVRPKSKGESSLQGSWFLSDEIVGYKSAAHPPTLLQKEDRKRLSGIDDNPIEEINVIAKTINP